MTASAFWSDTPKNRHAAERMGTALPSSDTRDAHSVRRRTTVLLAGLFLLANVLMLGAMLPSVIDTVTAIVTLPDLAAPPQR